MKNETEEQRLGKNDVVAGESVNCPVCGARLPAADNALINSHVGEVLIYLFILMFEMLKHVSFHFEL